MFSKKCVSILVEKRLREPSRLGNRKGSTSIKRVLTAEMRGEWLSGRAGKHAAGPAAKGHVLTATTGTYLLSRRYRSPASLDVTGSQVTGCLSSWVLPQQ